MRPNKYQVISIKNKQKQILLESEYILNAFRYLKSIQTTSPKAYIWNTHTLTRVDTKDLDDDDFSENESEEFISPLTLELVVDNIKKSRTAAVPKDLFGMQRKEFVKMMLDKHNITVTFGRGRKFANVFIIENNN